LGIALAGTSPLGKEGKTMPDRFFPNTPPNSRLHFGVVAESAAFTANGHDTKGGTYSHVQLLNPGVALQVGAQPLVVTVDIALTGKNSVAVVCWMERPGMPTAARLPMVFTGVAGQGGAARIHVS
jgi:hypothetical protein